MKNFVAKKSTGYSHFKEWVKKNSREFIELPNDITFNPEEMKAYAESKGFKCYNLRKCQHPQMARYWFSQPVDVGHSVEIYLECSPSINAFYDDNGTLRAIAFQNSLTDHRYELCIPLRMEFFEACLAAIFEVARIKVNIKNKKRKKENLSDISLQCWIQKVLNEYAPGSNVKIGRRTVMLISRHDNLLISVSRIEPKSNGENFKKFISEVAPILNIGKVDTLMPGGIKVEFKAP
jgi:hypothetical protein